MVPESIHQGETIRAISEHTGTAEPVALDGPWRESKWLVVVELIVLAMVHVAGWLDLVPTKIPLLLLLGWLSLWLRKFRWRNVGLLRYRTWPTTLALGIAAGALLEAFQLLVTQPILVSLTGHEPDLHTFRAMTGNIKLALLGLALSWTLAAVGEELVYRGYLMNRLADLGRGTRGAWVVSLLVVSTVFGLGHGYQGTTGILEEGIAGLLLGCTYLATGRNLAVPIVAHGVQDSIDVVLIYLGIFPGM